MDDKLHHGIEIEQDNLGGIESDDEMIGVNVAQVSKSKKNELIIQPIEVAILSTFFND